MSGDLRTILKDLRQMLREANPLPQPPRQQRPRNHHRRELGHRPAPRRPCYR